MADGAGEPPGMRLREDWLASVEDGRVLQRNLEALEETPDVGPIVADKIHAFFREPHNLEVIAELQAAGVRVSVAASIRSLARCGAALE